MFVRPPKEIVVLLVLLFCAMASVLWYVIDRRARLLSPPPVAAKAAPVDLTKHDGQTIDFSSGRPVVKDTPEDKAALAAAVKDMADASKNVTFDSPKKPTEAPAAPAKP